MRTTAVISLVLSLVALSAHAGTEIKLNSGTINTSKKVLNITEANTTSEWIIQFQNHVTESTKEVLKSAGLTIYSYMPEDALVVRGTNAQMTQLSQRSDVQAVMPLEAYMKLSPTLGVVSSLTSDKRETFLVSVFDQSERSIIEETVKKLSKEVLIQKSAGKSFVVTTTRAELLKIAALAGVENIQAVAEIKPLHMDLDGGVDVLPWTSGDYTDLSGNETGTKVMGFDSMWALGLTGQNQVAAMADTGLDSGDARAIHQDFANAVKSGYAVGMFGKTWADPMGHGTHVAGSVLGRGTASGGLLKGGAYSAQLVVQGMWSPMLNNLSVPANLAGVFTQAYNDGARVHTNSWGAAANFGAYEKMAATVDQVMFDKEDMLILFAAGNSGVDKDRDGKIDPNSVGTPGTAKNALTVGASENLVLQGGIQRKVSELKPAPEDWPVAPVNDDRLSDNINGIACFSSRGPTADGRTKPDIVAPGTNILSVRDQQPGASELWGAYNKDYTFSGGTSMATPLTAGAAVLTRQFLIEKKGIAAPTAALVKAYMLHTAAEMYPGQFGEVGKEHGQEILTLRPNNDEGYGRVDLNAVVSSPSFLFLDQATGVATSENKEYSLTVPAGKLMANIVWTDAPGSTNASKALVNDLDMEVVLPDGKVLAANDAINNNSFVQGATGAGTVTVRVKGVNVPMGKNGKQPFAVVVSVK
jgi:subtilisin family serine protease